MFRRALELVLVLTIAAAAAAAETSPSREALAEAKRVLWDKVFNAAAYEEGLAERPTIRIEVKYYGDDYDYPVAALALTFAPEADCIAARQRGEVRGMNACPHRWRAHVVRAPEPESTPFEGLRPRWRGSALEARLAEQPSLMAADAETLIAALDVERLIIDEASCPEAQPDLAGLETVSPAQKSYAHMFDPSVTLKGLGGIYLDPDRVGVRVVSHASVLDAVGVPESGRVTGWGRDLLLGFDACFVKAGYGPLWRPPPK